jgi:hypothetical protein
LLYFVTKFDVDKFCRVIGRVAGLEMTNPSRRRIFSAQIMPVSIAVLCIFLYALKNVRGADDYETLSRRTFVCNGTEPCVHQAQQGSFVTSNNHGVRETVDTPMIPKNSTELDPNNPCPTTGLFDLGSHHFSSEPQASRRTMFYREIPSVAMRVV